MLCSTEPHYIVHGILLFRIQRFQLWIKRLTDPELGQHLLYNSILLHTFDWVLSQSPSHLYNMDLFISFLSTQYTRLFTMSPIHKLQIIWGFSATVSYPHSAHNIGLQCPIYVLYHRLRSGLVKLKPEKTSWSIVLSRSLSDGVSWAFSMVKSVSKLDTSLAFFCK